MHWTPYPPGRSNALRKMLSDHVKKLPIFWGHGANDVQIPHDAWKPFAKDFAVGIGKPFIDSTGNRVTTRLTKEEIQKDGLDGLRFLSYPGLAHSIFRDELRDLSVWVGAILEKSGVKKD